MEQDASIDAEFEQHRPRLLAVAGRLLGTATDADDAVQEAWLRLHRSDIASIENVAGWLTTVITRIALDMLRARAARRDSLAEVTDADRSATHGVGVDPEHDVVLVDAVGEAMLVVLETLRPAERIAFVLHDTFAVPFDEIATILGRSPNAVKQLASRARHKVQGEALPERRVVADQRHVVDAFLAASRSGNLDALIAVLHPDIALHADSQAIRMGSPAEAHGAATVAAVFSGRALGASAARLDEMIGITWIVGQHPKVAWEFTIDDDDTIVRIDMIADTETLGSLEVDLLA